MKISGDAELYRTELTKVLHGISGAGAAIFEGLNEHNALKQGWQITKSAISYTKNPLVGLAQFKYWLATNKNECKKILQFLQLQTHNSVVKKANKSNLPKVEVVQKLYVPMIAKIFDLDESKMYDGLTDE